MLDAAATAPKTTSRAGETLLEVNNIEVIYNHVILVLKGVSLSVPKGSITALLGGNGAGKTTTLKAVSNLLRSERGEVTKGAITYRGENVTDLDPAALVKKGVIQVMEGRHCFEHLTVEENLLTGAYTRTDGAAAVKRDLDMVYEYFPRLKERQTQRGGTLSGGEQQMLAIGRALMSQPRLLLLDEPSLGLAPLIVKQIFKVIEDINREQKMTVFLVEQNAFHALKLAHRGYVMVNGNITLQGTGRELLANEEVRTAYLEGGH